MSFEWDGKMLSGVNGIADIKFTYNNEGIRTSKTVDGVKTEYVIEGKDTVFEISDNATTAYIYDSWGNVVLIEGDAELANKNPFRYRSYYYDEDQRSLACFKYSESWVKSISSSGSCMKYKIDNRKEFIDAWNSLVYATVVIIDMHGHPYCLGCNGDVIYSDEIKNELLLKNVKFVWLLSCNVGHQDYRKDNVATAIADRISGVVIASDGPVMASVSFSKTREVLSYKAISGINQTWLDYANGRTKSKYWRLCKLKRSTGYPVWYDWGVTVTSLNDIKIHLEKNGFISFK